MTSRSQIVDDVFEFAKTERLGYDVALDVASYLEHELEYVPWSSAFSALSFVDRQFAGNSNYSTFHKYVNSLVAHLFNATGFEDVNNEAHYNKQSRILAINWACRTGSEECLKQSNTKLKQYLTGTTIHQNVRASILCNGLRNGTIDDFLGLWKKLEGEQDLVERSRIISGLTCSRDEEQLTALIQTSTGSAINELSYKSSSERYRVFNNIVSNGQVGLKVAIAFLLENLDDARSYYSINNVNTALTRTAAYVVTPALTIEVFVIK